VSINENTYRKDQADWFTAQSSWAAMQ